MDQEAGRPITRKLRGVDTSNQEWGSDVVADMLKGLGFDYISYNPGASFRGIEESIVNYNDNLPQTITVANEGLSVSIAHGYAKATGDLAACVLHDTVGTLNGAMSVFNAYIDRVPILILSGNGPLRKSERRPWIDWVHSNLQQGSLLENFVAWTDEPAHSDGVVESMARGAKVALTPRQGPTYITFDHGLQENSLSSEHEIPDLSRLEAPGGFGPEPELIDQAAELLVDAELPVILADLVGTSREAVTALISLAEELSAPVIDSRQRFNFPNTHPCYFEDIARFSNADVLLALDVRSLDYFITNVNTATHEVTEKLGSSPKLIEIGTQDIGISHLVADYYELHESDVSIVAKNSLALPALDAAVRSRLNDDPASSSRRNERSQMLADAHQEERDHWQGFAEEVWDDDPISVPRMASELWSVIKDEEWVVVSGLLQGWPHRLWEIDEFDQYVGGKSGGAGTGYSIGASIGGALAYGDSGRVPINLQSDGDLMQFPAGLWTMAHYDIPLLTLVHNNGTLYNSTNHRMKLAKFRGRDSSFERARIGTGFWDPSLDFAAIAESFGVSAYGSITAGEDLAPALEQAVSDVKSGKPALVDVVAQPR